jgi:hypothetical protein
MSWQAGKGRDEQLNISQPVNEVGEKDGEIDLFSGQRWEVCGEGRRGRARERSFSAERMKNIVLNPND